MRLVGWQKRYDPPSAIPCPGSWCQGASLCTGGAQAFLSPVCTLLFPLLLSLFFAYPPLLYLLSFSFLYTNKVGSLVQN